MQLQTQLNIQKENNQIDYSSKVLLLGSCFAENIGGKLEYFKFQNLMNPFGIVFNPVSTEILVRRALEANEYAAEDIFLIDNHWHCFETHSLVTSESKEEYLNLLNTKLSELREYLLSASHIILTFGTAWVYSSKASGKVVANCHKIPQQEFKKQLLSPSRISEALLSMFKAIHAANPKATIINTVSPVRHIKDGMVENSLGKANLRSGIHEFSNEYSSSGNLQTFYFPAYEIMMDELRDYRFYDKDMLHPSDLAIEIIWEKFKNAWISEETYSVQKEIESIQKGLQHRAFNPNSESHQKFQKNLEIKIEKLKRKYPFVSFVS